MKPITKITASAISAFALAGLLAGCDKKANDTTATPAATASAIAPDATDAATSATDDANRNHADAMPNDMAERHRQDMDHDSMRRGGQMGPMGPGGTPTATDSPAAAPMKDM